MLWFTRSPFSPPFSPACASGGLPCTYHRLTSWPTGLLACLLLPLLLLLLLLLPLPLPLLLLLLLPAYARPGRVHLCGGKGAVSLTRGNRGERGERRCAEGPARGSDIQRKVSPTRIAPTPASRPAHPRRAGAARTRSVQLGSHVEGEYGRSALGECSEAEGARVETANVRKRFIVRRGLRARKPKEVAHSPSAFLRSVRPACCALPGRGGGRGLAEPGTGEGHKGGEGETRSDENGTGKCAARPARCKADGSIPRHGRVRRGRERGHPKWGGGRGHGHSPAQSRNRPALKWAHGWKKEEERGEESSTRLASKSNKSLEQGLNLSGS